VTDRTAQIVLASLGIVVDILRIDVIAYNLMGRWHLRRKVKQWARSRTQDTQDTDRPGNYKWHNMPDMPDGLRLPGWSNITQGNDADERLSYEHRARY
jgi:hypothetical protein